jgi:tRNA threonylcarbamoyladenosine biosynthesis protein TsaE
MKKSFEIKRLEDIKPFVTSILPYLTLGTLVTLNGPLGVGKTTLVQEMAKQLGVKSRVISPTFTIMKVYSLELMKGRLLHVDAYRLEKSPSFGLDEEMGEDTITMIEWPEKLSTIPSANQTIHLTIRFVNEQSRTIEMEIVSL